MFDFEVKIAQNEKEILQALKLRYEVFRLEMGGNLPQGQGREIETDIYDKFSDHLIVIDRTMDKVVGTYRFLLDTNVDKRTGFHSERFFDIRNIKKLADGHRILELGRSCIHRDYRQRPVINLLWSGIAKYVKDNNVRYLFGSVRLYTNKPQEVSRIFRFIKERYYARPEFRVYPNLGNKFEGLNPNVKIENPREIFRRLPPLIKGYIRAGVLVCGLPAVNQDLGSVIIFILLDTERLTASYKQHYLQ